MPAWRILNAEPDRYSAEARRILGSIAEVDERELSRDELIAALGAYDALIVRLRFQVDREVLAAGARLRAVATATTGLDHVDVAEAERRGIAVLSLRGEREFLEGVPATAEHTWALLLALVRRIPAAFDSVRQGRWERDAFRGHDLAGRRLGIVGMGRIGRRVAGYGLAFGMEVRGWDPDPAAAPFPAGVGRAESLPDLLRGSDVLSLHAALTSGGTGGSGSAGRRPLLGREELALLPPGAVVVNTARGELIDAAALVDALAGDRLGGAALDVIPGERRADDPDRRRLIEYARTGSNLLLTPHLGGATDESMARTEIFMAEKLKGFLEAGDAPAKRARG